MKYKGAAYTAIILDNEPQSMIELHKLLEVHCPSVKVVASLPITKESINKILEDEPSILIINFADTACKSLQFLSQLKEKSFHLIIITNLEQLPLEVCRLNALDYLSKPVKPEDLEKVICKLTDKSFSFAQQVPNENNTHVQLYKDPLPERIAFPHSRGYKFVTLQDIIYCKSISNYSILCLVGEPEFTVCKTLGQMEAILSDSSFVRIHRSFLVNKKRIKEYVKSDGGFLIMENHFQIPVSRNKGVELAQILEPG